MGINNNNRKICPVCKSPYYTSEVACSEICKEIILDAIIEKGSKDKEKCD